MAGMIPAPNDLIIIFDENISKVELPSASLVWSTSGENVATAGVDGTDYEFTVTLNTGYVIDSITLDDGSVSPAVLKSQTNNGFVITAGEGGLGGTYTITSKVSVSRKEIDLTSLTGWEALTAGDYTITVVAKAAGYKDSEPSAAVSVNVSAWIAPTIQLADSVVSTPIVEGVTMYKVYSNGSYIGYIDANNTWHGEVSE